MILFFSCFEGTVIIFTLTLETCISTFAAWATLSRCWVHQSHALMPVSMVGVHLVECFLCKGFYLEDELVLWYKQ